MNTQRITISIPGYLYRKLTVHVPKRKVSRFVAAALEEKLMVQTNGLADAAGEFFQWRTRLPKVDESAIREAIQKGRT